MSKMTVRQLMENGKVPFGTSGARGRVDDLTDRLVYGLCLGFVKYMQKVGDLAPNGAVSLAGDLRPSSPRILTACCKAIADLNCTPDYQGLIPSPAVALWGIVKKQPSLMVTGSHIPADRNGIKFNKAAGEILKADEVGLSAQEIELDESLFLPNGSFKISTYTLPAPKNDAENLYIDRYIQSFGSTYLKGQTIGFYEHSAVGRDILPSLLEKLGASVHRLGRSEVFVPVDTEAIRPEDDVLAANWAAQASYTSIFSTDGDSDRPLVSDEKGVWLRGDIAGILTSQYLKADAVIAPVSCNSALERCGDFSLCIRTRIGSPFVIEGLIQAQSKGAKHVVGYEANGGFFTQTPIQLPAGILGALPTRDPVIVLLSILGLCQQTSKKVSELRDRLPPRFGASGRLQEFPTAASQKILASLVQANESQNLLAIEKLLGSVAGAPESTNNTDGLRILFKSQDVVHLRPSGNAPEFRCYTEASSEARAKELLNNCIKLMETWRPS